MDKAELLKLADKYQTKAATDLEKYQETGLQKYYTSSCRNEDMETALRMAANASDDKCELVAIKGQLMELASRAQKILEMKGEIKELMQQTMMVELTRDIVAYGRMKGFTEIMWDGGIDR